MELCIPNQFEFGIAATARSEARARPQQFKLPLDVREWVDPWVLAEWTEKEFDRLHRRACDADGIFSHRLSHRGEVMARMLVFAYASRVFDSEEIVRKSQLDPVFRVLCDGEAPSAQELGHFRRNNRRVLELLLSRVLLRSVRERFGLDTSMLHDLQADLLQRAIERLNIARHMDQG